MTLLAGTFDDAMRFVAERRLFAEMQKRADSDAAHRAQGARQELGVLGADEGTLNDTLTKLRKGEIGSWRAGSRMRGAVPGVGRQIRNLPASVGTAVGQGRLGDAAAQLDVVGAKNVSPFAENFSPTTALTSLGLAGATAAGQNKVRENLTKYHLLHGHYGKKNDLFLDAWGEKDKDLVRRMRTRAAPGKGLWTKLKASVGVGGSRLPASTRGALNTAYETYHNTMPASAVGKASLLGLPALAAAAPMLYREWMGRGYRSGRKPINQLIEANQPPKEKK